MGDNVTALIVVIPALLTGIAALWQQRRGERSDDYSAASMLTTAATGLVDRLETEIKGLRAEVAKLTQLAEHWQELTRALEAEIILLGGDPQRIIQRIRQRHDD